VAEILFEPIPIAYRGLYADQHLVDAQQFGHSLVGASKIANSICHELLFEKITNNPRKYQVRFCVGPSRKNGLLQEIVAVVVTGLPLFPPFVIEIGRMFVEQMTKAMINTVLKKPSEADKALDVIAQQSQQFSDLARSMHEGHMQDKDRLFRLVTGLVRENRRSLRDLPEPVGRTVRTMAIGREDPIIIDEPIAEVLRSREGLELGEIVEYDVELVGVFKTNGVCRIKLLGQDKVMLGKISDPALDQPNNIYTRALNEGGPLHVIAKPTLKDGELYKLYITSASIPEEPTRVRETVPVTGG
jgi:hypothetical protein